MNVWKRKIQTTVRTVGPRDDPMGEFHYIVEVNWDQYVLVISELTAPSFWINGLPIKGGPGAEKLWEMATGFTRRGMRRARRRGHSKVGVFATLI